MQKWPILDRTKRPALLVFHEMSWRWKLHHLVHIRKRMLTSKIAKTVICTSICVSSIDTWTWQKSVYLCCHKESHDFLSTFVAVRKFHAASFRVWYRSFLREGDWVNGVWDDYFIVILWMLQVAYQKSIWRRDSPQVDVNADPVAVQHICDKAVIPKVFTGAASSVQTVDSRWHVTILWQFQAAFTYIVCMTKVIIFVGCLFDDTRAF